MITHKLVSSLNNKQIIQCNDLINKSFETNRFNDYKYAVIYTNNDKIIGFVGIYDNLLNQLCTSLEYRKRGIATKIIDTCKEILNPPIYLYIDKLKENTIHLLNFYTKNKFIIDNENEYEYKMVYR
jgi:citrate lyase synthetase